MRISSRIGSGTTVDLLLPTNGSLRDPDVRPAQSGERTDDANARSGLVVLVVDDDELVLSATSALLDDMGYQVIEATGGRRALEIVARTPIDLILTDQVMPEITGLQLANAVHAIRPDIPIVLASGFADIGTPVPSHIHRMTKPYSRKQLETALNALAAKVS